MSPDRAGSDTKSAVPTNGMTEENPTLPAAHCRQQAKDVRSFVERAAVPDIKKQLLEIAERYDRLAERAEKGQPEG